MYETNLRGDTAGVIKPSINPNIGAPDCKKNIYGLIKRLMNNNRHIMNRHTYGQP